jgi:hypothetical protein
MVISAQRDRARGRNYWDVNPAQEVLLFLNVCIQRVKTSRSTPYFFMGRREYNISKCIETSGSPKWRSRFNINLYSVIFFWEFCSVKLGEAPSGKSKRLFQMPKEVRPAGGWIARHRHQMRSQVRLYVRPLWTEDVVSLPAPSGNKLLIRSQFPSLLLCAMQLSQGKGNMSSHRQRWSARRCNVNLTCAWRVCQIAARLRVHSLQYRSSTDKRTWAASETITALLFLPSSAGPS